MIVYQLTDVERKKLEKLNGLKKNILLIICDFPDIGPCIIKDDITKVLYQDWRDLLDITLRPESHIEYTCVTPE